jgi:hypothetical protein
MDGRSSVNAVRFFPLEKLVSRIDVDFSTVSSHHSARHRVPPLIESAGNHFCTV